jgi:hypothetical protein
MMLALSLLCWVVFLFIIYLRISASSSLVFSTRCGFSFFSTKS